MNKILVSSEKEFIAIFENLDPEIVEKFLNIEFAFTDGSYISDSIDDDSIDEDQDIDTSKYKKYDEELFPASYPVVVIWNISKDFDRIGSFSVEFLEFVYPSDFVI